MSPRFLVVLVTAGVCALVAPATSAAADPTSTVGDYEPGAVAPAFTPGDDAGVGFPDLPSAELPFTGVPIVVVALIGIMALSVGVLVRRSATRGEEEGPVAVGDAGPRWRLPFRGPS
jgi:hypothetical protein